MSEQEAIEMLDSFYEMDEMYISAQMGIKALKKQINGGWIPVTEKLPEDRDWYLAVFKEKDTNYVLIPRVADYMNGHTNNYLTSDGWMIIDCDTNDIPNEYFKTLECIAWQPLPEPYKEQSNEA